MDIIEKWKIKCRERGKRVSLKLALSMYIAGGIVGSLIACALVLNYLESWQEIIRKAGGVTEKEVVTAMHTVYSLETTRVPDEVLRQLAILDMVQIISVLFCIITGIILVSRLYYKKKLELPLEILKQEIECIGRDDLNFECSYYSGDEMEEICTAFNHMRLKLIENHKSMWQLLEGQRELNAAFAHDIRTPVTVMKGCSQMLLRFYSKGRVSEKKMAETLKMIDRQADRLERFSDTMKEIHSLDEWMVEKKKEAFGKVMDRLSDNLRGMAKEGMEVLVTFEGEREEILYCDVHLIEEVADNLFSNGIRHGRKKLELKGNLWEGKLYLYVKDDGPGFLGEARERAMRPYFTTDKEHFGMGLTICKTLCAKHGGDLELTNSIEGGAIACAIFKIGKE